MPVKVSVVMATYNSGDRFLPAARSVLSQSLPPDEYELIVVDDGSTDATPDQARALAAEHPQVLVDRIPNSGWPGRPRNIGTRMASGEYLLYMDHDDELTPEALERAYAFAAEHRADVLLAKVVVVGGPPPGWRTFQANVGCVERVDQDVLQLLTPHKFYRRQFVLDRGVEHPEGRVRLEDYDFNAQAFVRAERIAVLADYPCYRWHHHDSNAHKGGIDVSQYWSSFDHSLLAPERELPPGDEQDEYLLRWYRSRILGRVGQPFAQFSPERRDEWWDGLRASLRHFPELLDARLVPRDRLRAHLLRQGDKERLVQLSVADRASLTATAESVAWVGGALAVTVSGQMLREDGSQVAFVREGDRLLRHLDP